MVKRTARIDIHGEPVRAAALLAILLLPACDGSVPLTRPTDVPAAAAAEGGAQKLDLGNEPPRAQFKLQPAPDAAGAIAGDAPFELSVNLCRSSDPEEDKLLFSIDADGDGRLDESGSHGGNCRRTFTYAAEAGTVRELSPRLCLVDLDAAGQPRRAPECRTYALTVRGPRAELEPDGRGCPEIPAFVLSTGTKDLTWVQSADVESYNVYVKVIPNCRLSDRPDLDRHPAQKFTNVQSPFDLSANDRCNTCYYASVTSVARGCESEKAWIGFSFAPCR